MKLRDFIWCVWFVPEKGHPWFDYTNGFVPHMTVKAELNNYKDAEKLYFDVCKDLVGKGCGVCVKMLSGLEQHNEPNFGALVYNIEIKDENTLKALWWPNGAHISIRYRCDGTKFSEKEMKEVDTNVVVREGYLKEVRLMRCTGHFMDWTLIKRTEIV